MNSLFDRCGYYFYHSVAFLGLLVPSLQGCGADGQLDEAGTGGALSSSGGSGGLTPSIGGSASGSVAGATGGASGGSWATGGGEASGGSGGDASVGGVASGGAQSGGAFATGGAPAGGGQGAVGGQATGGQDGTGGVVSAASWADIIYMLNAGCASCHSPPAATTLRPEDTGPNDNLHMTLTTHQVKECGGMRLVEPGQPDKSALLMLLNAECTKNGEQFFMPETCGLTPCFPQEWMIAIRLWIEAGAVAE